MVERRPAQAGSGFEYALTAAGRELEPVIIQLGEWGARWVRSRLGAEDLDVALLMWDMHCNVRPEQFPARRVVVAFEFTDVPQSKRRWWLVSDVRAADLCVTDPGFEVDLLLISDLRTMTAIWVGDLSLTAALNCGALEAEGPVEFAPAPRGLAGAEPPGFDQEHAARGQSRLTPAPLRLAAAARRALARCPARWVRPSSRQVPQSVAVNRRADLIIPDDRDPPELDPVTGVETPRRPSAPRHLQLADILTQAGVAGDAAAFRPPAKRFAMPVRCRRADFRIYVSYE